MFSFTNKSNLRHEIDSYKQYIARQEEKILELQTKIEKLTVERDDFHRVAKIHQSVLDAREFEVDIEHMSILSIETKIRNDSRTIIIAYDENSGNYKELSFPHHEETFQNLLTRFHNKNTKG